MTKSGNNPIPHPEVKAYRPQDRGLNSGRYVTGGGRYLNWRILIYGVLPIEDVVYVMGHEMLHHILTLFIGGWASHGLDNIVVEDKCYA